MIHTKHATSQEAWEYLNETFVLESDGIIKNGGIVSGPQVLSYDHFLEINKSWVDPEFDFGYIFGYKIQKWSKLITNYIDFDWLDIAKSQVQEKEAKKTPSYNIAFKFSNLHNSGHACLISLVFQRRHTSDNPVVIINIRSSEITKRLLMDLLLVERMIEYIYGDKHGASLKLYCGNMYLTAENFVMYHNHRDFESLFKGKNGSKIIKRVLEVKEKFEKPEALNMKYKVHRRSARRLQKIDIEPLLARDLTLFPYKIDYPEDCITDEQRKKYKRKLKKDGKNGKF